MSFGRPLRRYSTESKDAAEFYVSVFPNSEITNVSYYGEAGPRPAGTVLAVDGASVNVSNGNLLWLPP
jgi:predicted 3-demethylubiquinone-9 3-methyltransferase (glyoxalase superfamily)